jgi:hypothetical protein
MRGSIYLSTSDIWPYASVAFGRSGLVRGDQFYLSTSEHPPDDDNGYINASYIDVSFQVRNLSSTEIFSLQCFLRKSSFLCF